MKRRCMVVVRGRRHEWAFDFIGDEKYLERWREDGLDVIVIENSVPQWASELGLLRVWCWCQDLWRWMRLW